MENLASLLENLQVVSDSKETGKISENIKELVDEITNEADRAAICQEMVKGGVLKVAVLAVKEKSEEVQAIGAELVAELAKVECCRLSCVEEGLVPVLVDKLSSDNSAVATQSCRALGNICYEYDGGRSHVMKAGGGIQLLNLLKKAADKPETPENHQLRLVATGFLLNLLNSYETDKKDDPIDSLLIDVLVLYLDKFAANDDIPTHVLLSLSCLADSEYYRELVVSRNVSQELVKVLKENQSPEVIESCLELITNLIETEMAKTQMSVGGVCEAVIDVVKRYQDDSSSELSSAIIKTATDLIVLILVGEESMTAMYGNGEGPVYLAIVEWLSSDAEELQISGAFSIGNFAQNDLHCIQMVKSGVAKKLLNVLKSHNTADGDLRIQHAVLSALRNLSIAKENKLIILEEDVLDVLLPMAVSIKTFPVVFKLLATLRMLINGQPEAAVKLGKSREAIAQIVAWCDTDEHPGVQGEANRILSWIIKNCNGDTDVINELIEAGALKHLVSMLASEHTLMVNEACLGLALTFAKCVDSKVANHLEKSSFPAKVEKVLARKDLVPEFVGNIISMLVALTSSEETLSLIQTEGIRTGVEELKNQPYENVNKLLSQLLENLQKETQVAGNA